jgi:threonyl-tRNA synthetase
MRSAATGSAARRRSTSTCRNASAPSTFDKDGEKKQPVMVHRAICGSLERFLGILIESYAGHMPLWFAPLQVVVATITSEADDYARPSRRKVSRPLPQREDQLQGPRAFAGAILGGFEVETVNIRNEKINYKAASTRCAKVAGDPPACGMREAHGGDVAFGVIVILRRASAQLRQPEPAALQALDHPVQ